MAITYLSDEDAMAKMTFLVSGGGAQSLEDLMFSGPVKDAETFSAGALVSLNSDGTIQAGLAAATSMPMIAINGANDYDASQYSYNLSKGGTSNVQAKVNCFVCSGGFEVSTTEYLTTDTYVKGTSVLAASEDTLGDVELAAAAYSLKTVVGIISTGVQGSTSGTGRARARLSQTPLLHFWTLAQIASNTDGGS